MTIQIAFQDNQEKQDFQKSLFLILSEIVKAKAATLEEKQAIENIEKIYCESCKSKT